MLLLILGREKNLSKAEAEVVFGGLNVVNDEAITVTEGQGVSFDSLGGTIKVAEVISEDSQNPVDFLVGFIDKEVKEGKINFGLSFYGFDKPNNQLGINVKKRLKKLGRSVRYLSAREGSSLNAATVIYNKLTSKGCEIILAKNRGTGKVVLARTVHVQNINEYSKRDYDKPCRDRKVGMLPPKLSQTMINLSGTSQDVMVVDPFSGSGGLVMEASLMGRPVMASDISSKMVECTNKNLDWLKANYPGINEPIALESKDVRDFQSPNEDYAVITEGYLGTNFFDKPKESQVQAQLGDLESLYTDFLRQLKKQPNNPISVVIAVPFWEIGGRQINLDIIDEISEMGYTIHEFKSVDGNSLRYKRESQYTGRRIFVLN